MSNEHRAETDAIEPFSAKDLQRLWPRSPGCPSELDLDLWVGNKLAAEPAAALSAHVTDCADCRERVQLRRAGFAAFPQIDPSAQLAAILRRATPQQTAPRSSRYRPLRRWAAPILAAAAAVALWLQVRPPTPPRLPMDGAPYTTDTTRTKGGLSLHLYRLRHSQVEPLGNGDRIEPGDRLRITIDLPQPGQVSVLGIEPSGRLYVAYPQHDDQPTRWAAGSAQVLPGALEPEAAQTPGMAGRETLYLLLCPDEVGIPAKVCQASRQGTGVDCPSGCLQTVFALSL